MEEERAPPLLARAPGMEQDGRRASGAYCVRVPLLLPIPFRGRLVTFPPPLEVRQIAVRLTDLPSELTTIWMLPQLCWKLLEPEPWTRFPFWLLMPWSTSEVAFGEPSDLRQVAVKAGWLPWYSKSMFEQVFWKVLAWAKAPVAAARNRARVVQRTFFDMGLPPSARK